MNLLIKHLREKGITQVHLIRELGISNMTWYNYKTRRTKMPKSVKLAICYILNLEYESFFK